MVRTFYAKRSVELLDDLERLGFNNTLYRQIHHIKNDTINSHKAYCNKSPKMEFAQRSNNALVQLRLLHIHDQIVPQGDADRLVDTQMFQRLVNEALKRYPLTRFSNPTLPANYG